MQNPNGNSESEFQRQKAEELLFTSTSISGEETHNPSETAELKLMHELEIHRIELKLQNDELKLAISAAQDAIELYDFAPTGFLILSKEGDIRKLNHTATKILGKERSHLINSRFGFFVTDDTKPIFNFFLEKIFISRAKESAEVILSISRNLPIYVLLNGIVAGNGEHCLITIEDITGRKQVEEALKESEEKYRLLSENVSDGVTLFENNKVKYFSEGHSKMLGYDKQEIENISFEKIFSFIHSDDKAYIKECIERAHIQQQKKFQYNYRAKTKNGKFIWIEDRIDAEYDSNGNHFRSIIHSRDITQRKLAEEDIKLKNEELLKLIDEKDKFYSILAHDLRGPFNPLLGLANVLVDELPTLTPDEIHLVAVNIRTSANNLYRLLENLLEWSRMQRGLTSFNPASFLLMPATEEKIQPVLKSADIKGIGISYDIPAGLSVFADENMFGSAIRNLVSNAVKFTFRGGQITIKAQLVVDDFVEISIRDTGIGMSNHILDRLFILDDGKSRKGTEGETGTGLGLVISKDFIEKNGGQIRVESEIGKGSTFYFSIPKNKI